MHLCEEKSTLDSCSLQRVHQSGTSARIFLFLLFFRRVASDNHGKLTLTILEWIQLVRGMKGLGIGEARTEDGFHAAILGANQSPTFWLPYHIFLMDKNEALSLTRSTAYRKLSSRRVLAHLRRREREREQGNGEKTRI